MTDTVASDRLCSHTSSNASTIFSFPCATAFFSTIAWSLPAGVGILTVIAWMSLSLNPSSIPSWYHSDEHCLATLRMTFSGGSEVTTQETIKTQIQILLYHTSSLPASYTQRQPSFACVCPSHLTGPDTGKSVTTTPECSKVNKTSMPLTHNCLYKQLEKWSAKTPCRNVITGDNQQS